MTLNKKNWFARYYNWIAGEYPKDVCSFFWGSVIFILLSPFILIGKPMTYSSYGDRYPYFIQSFLGAVTYLFLLLLVIIGNETLEVFGYEFIYLWAMILGGFAIGLLSVALLFFILFVVAWVIRKTVYSTYESHLISNTTDVIGAIRGKYCTKITWKE